MMLFVELFNHPLLRFTFTFMHLADAFIQSDLQCIQAIHFFYYQYVCSLGIEPMTFCAANAMLYHRATGPLNLRDLERFNVFLFQLISSKAVSGSQLYVWRRFL